MYLTAEIVMALRNTWLEIVQEAFPPLGVKQLPVFALLQGDRLLGSWSGMPENTLSLNEELFSHPWYVVEEVLRHEIAHQLKDLLYPTDMEPPHGARFREICKIIGADPAATAEEILLDDRVYGEAREQEDSVTAKIRKLLAMAERGSDNEAEVALCKAHELMAKYGTAKEDLNRTSYVDITVGMPMARISCEQKVLASLLQKFWPVQVIWGTVPFGNGGYDRRASHILHICATPENARIASYVYDFISNHILYEFQARYLTQGLRAGDRRNFTLGALNGLYSALEKQMAVSKESALILANKDPELQKYYASHYPHVRSVQNRYRISNREAYSEGQAVGSHMTISPGLEDSSQKPKALPGK